MEWIINKVLLVLLTLIMIGCASNKSIDDKYQNVALTKLQAQADKAFSDNDYKNAAENYTALSSYYPGSKQAKTAQLKAIYSNAMLKNSDLVESLARTFLHQYPRDKHASYAYYMLGIAPLFNHSSFLQRSLNAKPELRGTDLLNKSFSRLQAFLRLYPKSRYTPQVRLILLHIKRLLAAHENNVAEYYYAKAAYQAAINRAMDSLEISLSKNTALDALQIMHAGFSKLGNAKQALKVQQVIDLNR